MQGKKASIGLLCLLCSVLTSWGQADTLKVLFVGNSYTYFWNLPQTVEAMSAFSDGKYIVARQSTAGGTTWKQHWEGEKDLQSKQLIENGQWDIVIIQNHSRSAVDNLNQFMEYGSRFVELIKNRGAKPLLYMTWAREYNPLMQKEISNGYNALGAKNNVEVVPVGEVWEAARKLRPDLRLYDPDGSHPSTLGAYLTACVFYSYLLEEPSSGLPERIHGKDGNGEKLYLSIMSKTDAEFMQNMVDNFLRGGDDE